MTFLDIIIDPDDPIFDSLRETSVPEPEAPYYIKSLETTDTVAATSDVEIPDTVAATSDVITDNQQIADIAPNPTEAVGMMSDNLLLTIIVVLLALCLCSYFVWRYRKNNA
jgi:heme/copper-type cytochrome/quinol oxidase subunit 2